jgi:hypothetical protein
VIAPLLAAAALAMGGLLPAAFTMPGPLTAFAASGARVAVASYCDLRTADLVRSTRPVRVKTPGMCPSDSIDGVDDLWLGGSTIAAQLLDAPSPHGEDYTLWSGPTPAGPLRQQGGDWGWTDSDVPAGWGCAWTVAAGGGAVASTQTPNRLAIDRGYADTPSCPAKSGGSTTVTLQGATRTQLSVPGSWSVLATDGARVALATLGADALPTGQVALVAADGTRLAAPAVDARAVETALQAWLTPRGLVLVTRKGIDGPGATIRGIGAYPEAALAAGRLFYVKGRTVRVRRLRDGADRLLLRLPTSVVYLAAGAFGLALATSTDTKTSVYRVPQRTIDGVLPRR